jgi:cation:H+ antiporter
MGLLIIPGLVFVVSLAFLVKGADWFVESAEKIGLALKISPFVIGVTVVALGTSFPELASSLAAVLKEAVIANGAEIDPTEIVAANVIGSNIANILLIIGLAAVATKSFLAVKRSLIDIDLPLLASVTVLFGFIIWDGEIVRWEGILLLFAFLVYLLYTIFQRGDRSEKGFTGPQVLEELPTGEIFEVLPSRADRRKSKKPAEKINSKVFLFLIIGAVCLTIGANYLIDSVMELSEVLEIGVSAIAIFAVAVGTSLPELVVSVRAAAQKKYEIALGNVFGSNVFNALIVIGIPSLIKNLSVSNVTLEVGFPFMVIATLLLVISGITRRISVWEGSMFLIIYILFIIRIFSSTG